jgi:hypothetical protein
MAPKGLPKCTLEILLEVSSTCLSLSARLTRTQTWSGQLLVVVSKTFEQEEGRQLQYNFITVRIYNPNTELVDYDCLVGRCVSSQTVRYTHTGTLKFDCFKDSGPDKIFVNIDGSISDRPRTFSSRISHLFRRFVAGRLSHEHFAETFEGILMGCPMRCKAETVKTGNTLCAICSSRSNSDICSG